MKYNQSRAALAPGFVTLLLFVSPLLVACGDVKTMLGQDKQAPDEFAVMTRAPLSMPPNFSLRAPNLGAERPQEPSSRNNGRNVVLKLGDRQSSGAIGQTKQESSEVKIRTLLGTDKANFRIREILDKETKDVVFEERAFIDKLLSWNRDLENHSLVDAAAEARRIRTNQKAGKLVNEGEIPTIKRGKTGLINRILQ